MTFQVVAGARVQPLLRAFVRVKTVLPAFVGVETVLPTLMGVETVLPTLMGIETVLPTFVGVEPVLPMTSLPRVVNVIAATARIMRCAPTHTRPGPAVESAPACEASWLPSGCRGSRFGAASFFLLTSC
jgi:hypothetical protein